jgi:uncharacterized heparinase superfamily protein
MNKVLLLFNTVKYLKFRQIVWRLYYLLRKKLSLTISPKLDSFQLVEANHKVDFIQSLKSYITLNRFKFLNEDFEVNDWNDQNRQKLWLYNLHYFDFLLQDDVDKHHIINEWIEKNSVGIGNGWEPYPISLRVVNWIKYHIQIKELNQKQLDSLYLQTNFLSQCIENHILGNHLFENGKTLFIAGLFFNNKHYTKLGYEILAEQIEEQILEDGAHFELSPMYHCIILEGMLDLVNFSSIFKKDLPIFWKNKTQQMLEYLEAVIHPDGHIVCFNDSTFGIAKRPEQLFSYARSLDLKWGKELKESFSSGLVRFEKKDSIIFIDAGAIGPDYIPGHAHADNLTFELSHLGHRIIVDTGISTYESNERRHLERSTSSHNTVVIDKKNQSEVWASFRVAKRVYPSKCSIKHDFFAGSYTGDCHTREIDWRDSTILIVDTIKNIENIAESFLHFHPDVSLKVEANSIFVSKADQNLLRIDCDCEADISISDYQYAEGFNNLRKSKKVKFTYKGSGEFEFKQKIILL